MSTSRQLPKSWEHLTVPLLREECRARGLRAIGIKHELIKAIVAHDIEERAKIPRPIFTYENDPTGAREQEQVDKEYDDEMRDHSVMETLAIYHRTQLAECNNAMPALKQNMARKKGVGNMAIIDRVNTYRGMSNAVNQAPQPVNNQAAIQ